MGGVQRGAERDFRMSIFIEINSNDNESFCGYPREEMLRILREAVQKIELGRSGNILLNDINGNRVGQMFVDLEGE